MTVAISWDGVDLEADLGAVVTDLSEDQDSEVRSLDRLQGRGIVLAEQVITGRKFRLRGTIGGATQALHLTAISALHELFTRTGTRLLVVDTTREAKAYVSRSVKIVARPGGFLVSQWEVELTLADPVFSAVVGSSTAQSVTGGTVLAFSVTNSGDAAAHWRAQITTGSTFSDTSLLLYNDTSGRVLRVAGFGLTDTELLAISTEEARIAQESGAWPDPNFGVEVVDGDFWLLEPGVNRIRVLCDSSITLHLFWAGTYWGAG
jgi:hypothetical protein